MVAVVLNWAPVFGPAAGSPAEPGAIVMKQQMQWVAYIKHDGQCHVSQVCEMRGLPENHYDYEEPVFLPSNSIKVFVENLDDLKWRETLKRHLEAQHPELVNHQLLKVPRNP
jgi:hypothetical protein